MARLYQQANERNRQAAQLFFEHFNRDRAKDVIDLHGLYVAEALEYLQRKIDQCRSEKIQQVTVITGIGNNSPDNIAKIKPEVEKCAHQHGLKMIPCSGSVLLQLAVDEKNENPPSEKTHACAIQ